jgi:hypothetical protein
MEVRFTLQPALNEIKRQLDAAERMVEKAEIATLNEVGRAVQTALTDEIKRVFDRPTPTTQKSVKLFPARRQESFYINGGGKRFECWVFIQDKYRNRDPGTKGAGTAPSQYLGPQVDGGERPLKKFELRTMAMAKGGHGRSLFPQYGFLVPTHSTPEDKYGNVSGGTIFKMLADLDTMTEEGFQMKSKTKGRGSLRTKFIIPRYKWSLKKIRPTIFLRVPDKSEEHGSRLIPYFTWKSQQQGYKKKFNIEDIASNVVGENFGPSLRARFNR